MEKPDRRYSISDVSKMLDLSIRTLRIWEEKFKQFKPKRDRVKRRYYLAEDIEIARRIKQLVKHEKFSAEGARMRLTQELHIEGKPRTRKALLDLVDSIENDVRDLIDLLDKHDKRV